MYLVIDLTSIMSLIVCRDALIGILWLISISYLYQLLNKRLIFFFFEDRKMLL